MPARPPLFLALALLPCLGACAAAGSYPSLAPRPGEEGTAAKAPPPPSDQAPAPIAASDSALTAQLAGLVEQARQGQTAFESALAATATYVGRAGAAGSESWIDAQKALSQLESARAPTATALSELDALARTRITSGGSAGDADFAAIAAATETVRAMAEKQDAEIGRLSATLATL
ncbi:MAG TPA: hypothetical protein VJR87_04235 [Allosphingosinicella sp.]|nr:hypothetical protein [Allosphingosinicella sp.]